MTAVRIAADGDQVVVRDGDAVWNPESGQALFDFAVSEIAERTTPFVEAKKREGLDAADWFDHAEISEAERKAIGRRNAMALFRLEG